MLLIIYYAGQKVQNPFQHWGTHSIPCFWAADINLTASFISGGWLCITHEMALNLHCGSPTNAKKRCNMYMCLRSSPAERLSQMLSQVSEERAECSYPDPYCHRGQALWIYCFNTCLHWKEVKWGHTNIPGQINVQNCRGNKPDSSYITLLRNWHIRFLFSPSLLPLFWGKKCCAETAFRKMSIMCVLAALLTWRQKEILYLEFIDSLSNILNAFFLHLHFALRTWPLQVCTIHYLLKSSSPSALISDYKHECAWSRWKGTALIQTSASLMDKQL